MALHVSFGGPTEHEHLEELAAGTKGTALWTLDPRARKDDTVIFYIRSPLASFVAAGQVMDDDREDGSKYGWDGQVMGKVGEVAMLPGEVRLRDAAAAVPAWGYLRQPHRNTTVPDEHEAAFLRALGDPPAPNSDTTVRALENLRREAQVLSRSRNRKLRDAVIDGSGGTCGGCSTDFTGLEPRRWRSVLQVITWSPYTTSKGRPIPLRRTLSRCVPRATSSFTWGSRNLAPSSS